MKEQGEDHPQGMCLTCVHYRLTDRLKLETKERVYACQMMNVELTETFYALDCGAHYTEAMD